MIQHKLNSILFIWVLNCFNIAYTQQFSKEAVLETVSTTGFYSIDVTPALSSYLETDFRDLRITDDKGVFIPYIIKTATPELNAKYLQFRIVRNELTDSGKTVLIVENSQTVLIHEIELIIRNASVSRSVDVSGSDDINKWYTITENISFRDDYSDNNDRFVQLVGFPKSSYRYFKLIIHNGKNDALNIIEAGTHIIPGSRTTYNYVLNPPCTFAQIDSSDHISYIRVHQSAAYHIDKINLKIKGPAFFKREANVTVNKLVSNFTILSDSMISFYLPVFNTNDWVIKIFNGDNPPLQVKNITTAQEVKKIITYLEAEKVYNLLMTDSLAVKPDYDLSQFGDSIPLIIPSLKIFSVENNPMVADTSAKSNFRMWLWPVIIFVLIVLGLFTFRLAREVEKKK